MDQAVSAIKGRWRGTCGVVVVRQGAIVRWNRPDPRCSVWRATVACGGAQCDGFSASCYFMEEHKAIGLGMVGDREYSHLHCPQARIPMISTGDISRVAADRLMPADRGM